MANSIDLTKIVIDVDGGPSTDLVDEAGDIINYQLEVHNTGDGALTGINVVDPLLGTLSLDDQGNGDNILDPGEIWTYSGSYTVEQADIDAFGNPPSIGAIVNMADVFTDQIVTGGSSAVVFIDYAPGISFDKTILPIDDSDGNNNGLWDLAGEEIDYEIVVQNTGNVTLTNVQVNDPLLGGLLDNLSVTGDTNGNGDLDVGETWTYTGSYAITQDDLDDQGDGDGDIDNTATVDTNETPQEEDSEEAPLDYNPDLQIRKTAVGFDEAGNQSLDAAGDLIDYEIEVRNTGNITLTNVVVTDTLLGGPLDNSSVTGDDDGDEELDVGEIWTYSGSYAITQDDLDGAGNAGPDEDIDNIASVVTDQTPEMTDDEEVPLNPDPGLSIVKAVVGEDDGSGPTGDFNGILDAPGDVIDYQITVTNTGNVTLTNVHVTDSLTGLDTVIPSLAPLASVDFFESYAITQQDLDGAGNAGPDGDIDNVATANSDQTNEEDDDTSTPLAIPGIEITKIITATDDGTELTGDGNNKLDTVGDVIEYEVTVTNTGNVTLTNVTVVDPLTGMAEFIPSLAPNTSQSFDTKYSITQADLDGGGNAGADMDIDNTATADSDQTDEVDDSARAILEDKGNGGDPADCILLTEAEAWEIAGPGTWLGGTPGSDNGVFDDDIQRGRGGDGDDHIAGNGNTNAIYGDNGNDFLRGKGGDDHLFGNADNDALAGDDPLFNNVLPPQGNDGLSGGAGDDILAGGGGNDELLGGTGEDILIGGTGDDCLSGQDDNDIVLGGSGRDTLHGNDGDDCMAGQEGDDSMFGNAGNDFMSGGAGEDDMYGSDGRDWMAGNEGRDYIHGGTGYDTLFGGSNADTLHGHDGKDQLDGGDGDDALLGQRGDDLIFGGEGIDNIMGGGGRDRIDGGRDGDLIEGNDNADCIKGGAGNDTIYGDNADGQPAVGEASDLISGGSGNDTIYAGEDDDQVKGGSGADEIYGQVGDDVLSGNGGADSVSGGEGNDQIRGAGGRDTLDGDAGDDIIDGGGGRDLLNGGENNDCLNGGDGDDTLNGDTGDDTLDGGADHDTLDGGDGNDFLYGNKGRDELFGDRGQETGGQDTLLGGNGADTLHGGKHEDCLIADSGADEMWGEADGDDFVFGYDLDVNGDGDCDDPNDTTVLEIGNNNVIKDFNDEQGDRVVFHSDFETTLSATLVNGDADVRITSSHGGSVIIEGLVAELEGLNPNDPFFSDAYLIEFLLKGGIDGDGKGIIEFEDKCVTLPDCAPDAPQVGWRGRIDRPEDCCTTLSTEHIGDTTIFTNELDIATRYVEQDANVQIDQGELCIELLAEA